MNCDRAAYFATDQHMEFADRKDPKASAPESFRKTNGMPAYHPDAIVAAPRCVATAVHGNRQKVAT